MKGVNREERQRGIREEKVKIHAMFLKMQLLIV